MLPVKIDIDKLKGKASLLGERLFEHKAVYHQKCKKKFDEKVKRAEKRYSAEPIDNSVPVGKQLRRSSTRTFVKIDKCFFCEEPAADGQTLHKVTTFKLDARVRRAAKDTDNTNNTILY